LTSFVISFSFPPTDHSRVGLKLPLCVFHQSTMSLGLTVARHARHTSKVNVMKRIVVSLRVEWICLALGIAGLAGGVTWGGGIKPVMLGDWPGYPRVEAESIAISGSHAYVAARHHVQVVDLSASGGPQHVGGYSSLLSGERVAMVDPTTCVMVGWHGLFILDVGDPTDPRRLGRYDAHWGTPLGITVSWPYAYVALGNGGLAVIDLSDPENPVRIGDYEGGTDVVDVTVVGNHAYIADGDGGFRVIDVSNPASPVEVGAHATEARANAVAVTGNHAYVVARNYGLEVFDVSDPTTPVRIGTYETEPNASDVALLGSYACLTVGSELVLIDISDPGNPQRASGIDFPHLLRQVVALEPDVVVVLGAGQLRKIDLSNPIEPRHVGTFDGRGWATKVVSVDAYAYLADGPGGLRILDVSDPGAVKHVARQPTTSSAFGVAVSRSHAYVADQFGGLEVIDVSDPTRPERVGGQNVRWSATDVAVSESYAYVNDARWWPDGSSASPYGGEVWVIDISDPSNPKRIGGHDPNGCPNAIALSGAHVYVGVAWLDTPTPGGLGRDRGALQIVDVSDPANPRMVGVHSTEGWITGVALSGHHVFVTEHRRESESGSGLGHLLIIDVADPANPRHVATWETSGPADAVTVSGNTAWVAQGGEGLEVLDISNPARPWRVGFNESMRSVSGLSMVGGRVFVTSGIHGLAVFEMPPHLRLLERVGTNLRLTWESPRPVRLQHATSLVDPDWIDLIIGDADRSAELPPAAQHGFFRLLER
jgi:hypothetical protein